MEGKEERYLGDSRHTRARSGGRVTDLAFVTRVTGWSSFSCSWCQETQSRAGICPIWPQKPGEGSLIGRRWVHVWTLCPAAELSSADGAVESKSVEDWSTQMAAAQVRRVRLSPCQLTDARTGDNVGVCDPATIVWRFLGTTSTSTSLSPSASPSAGAQ